MDVYARLGVRPIVNARGMNTMASGSLMPKPVLDAMNEAAGAFVDMAELNRLRRRAHRPPGRRRGRPRDLGLGGRAAAGRRRVHRRETIPSGSLRLPDTAGMRNEIVIQRCDRIQYDQALRMAGHRPDRGRQRGRVHARERSRRRSALAPPRSSTSCPPGWPSAASVPSA